jgi:aminopeptidase-like protein
MMHVLAYSDGAHDLLAIADMINVPLWELSDTIERLKAQELLAVADSARP